jgi:hypothetical protein
MHHSIHWGSLVTMAFVAACGGTPGAAPHDMSQEGHEHAAETADASAAQHAAQYDAAATVARQKCSGRRQPDTGMEACWTSEVNPTKEHLAEAEHMRKAAADHRAASQALRDAEASACAGLSESDRDTSPLQRPGDIVAIQELKTPTGSSKAGELTRVAGAKVTIRAVPGLTKEYLQRLVSCHLARNSSMGHAMAEMATCPLGVKGATATVEGEGGAFVVRVTSEEDAAATEIVKRTRTLAPAQ